MRDFRDAKSMAKVVRETFATYVPAPTHSECLELVARMFGLPNWNVLAAKINDAEREHILAGEVEGSSGEDARTPAISPFFVVSDVAASISFYRDKLGFSLAFAEPADAPFFGIIYRDGAQVFLKSEEGVAPIPNSRRHAHLRWDAYVYSPDPDALYADFLGRGAPFSQPLRDTHDGLRGFEVTDPDGFVIFFGRPR